MGGFSQTKSTSIRLARSTLSCPTPPPVPARSDYVIGRRSDTGQRRRGLLHRVVPARLRPRRRAWNRRGVATPALDVCVPRNRFRLDTECFRFEVALGLRTIRERMSSCAIATSHSAVLERGTAKLVRAHDLHTPPRKPLMLGVNPTDPSSVQRISDATSYSFNWDFRRSVGPITDWND